MGLYFRYLFVCTVVCSLYLIVFTLVALLTTIKYRRVLCFLRAKHVAKKTWSARRDFLSYFLKWIKYGYYIAKRIGKITWAETTTKWKSSEKLKSLNRFLGSFLSLLTWFQFNWVQSHSIPCRFTTSTRCLLLRI